MRFFISILFASYCLNSNSQTVTNTDTIGESSRAVNIYNKALFGDSLSSSFCIVIKNEVKDHKHQYHSEQVIVLEGEGLMQLNGKSFMVKKNNVIFIPKNAIHSVKCISKMPLKILSIQAPFFDGNDRVFVD